MNAGEREGLRGHVDLAGLRQRAEFWTARDPSTIGHLYDRAAVGFAGEVLYLLDALEAAERKIAAVEALADEWERPGPKVQGTPEDAAAATRAALAAEDTAELPPRTHRNGPRSDSGPEGGQGDHRDDEGRSGALRWLDCRCGHPNADHWDGGECAHNGCMCGATYDDRETP